MNRLDALVLLLLVPFGLRGFFRGFLREGFGLVGIVGGALAAAAAAPGLAQVLVRRELLGAPAAPLVAGIGVFVGVWVAAQVGGVLADRVARVILLGGLNRVVGVALGVAKGAAVVGFTLVAVEGIFPSAELRRTIDGSRLGRPLSRFAVGLIEAGSSLVGEAARQRA